MFNFLLIVIDDKFYLNDIVLRLLIIFGSFNINVSGAYFILKGTGLILYYI